MGRFVLNFTIKRRAPIIGLAMAGAALAAGTVAGTGTATVTAPEHGSIEHRSIEHVAVETTATAGTARLVDNQAETASRKPVNYVTVRDALLRAQPNRTSTKLDVSQPGRGLTLYCYVYGGPGDGGLVWFKTHPWGSRFTGWMRAELLKWGSYPRPGRC